MNPDEETIAAELAALQEEERISGVEVAVNAAREQLVGGWGRVIVILDQYLDVVFTEVVDVSANGPALALKHAEELTRPRVGEEYDGGPLTPYSVTSSSGAFDVWTRVTVED